MVEFLETANLAANSLPIDDDDVKRWPGGATDAIASHHAAESKVEKQSSCNAITFPTPSYVADILAAESGDVPGTINIGFPPKDNAAVTTSAVDSFNVLFITSAKIIISQGDVDGSFRISNKIKFKKRFIKNKEYF